MTTTEQLPTADIDGKTVVGLKPVAVKRVINSLHNRSWGKPFMVKARGGDGVGSLGMYCEVIHRNVDHRQARSSRPLLRVRQQRVRRVAGTG